MSKRVILVICNGVHSIVFHAVLDRAGFLCCFGRNPDSRTLCQLWSFEKSDGSRADNAKSDNSVQYSQRNIDRFVLGYLGGMIILTKLYILAIGCTVHMDSHILADSKTSPGKKAMRHKWAPQ